MIFQMPKLLMHGHTMKEQAPMPERGITEHLYFPDDHEEINFTQTINSAFDLFFDATYPLLPKLSFTAGVRATFEQFSIKNFTFKDAEFEKGFKSGTASCMQIFAALFALMGQ